MLIANSHLQVKIERTEVQFQNTSILLRYLASELERSMWLFQIWDIQNVTMQHTKGTISIALVNEALNVALARGIFIDQIALRAGISPELLAYPKARISVSAYAQLWIEIAKCLNDEFFGMDSHPMRYGSYKLLCYLIISTHTTEMALRTILDYFNLLLDDTRARLEIDQHKAYIYLDDQTHIKRMFTYATYIMLVHGLLCWISDQRIPIHQIRVKCAQPEYPQDYYVRFCENIVFDDTVNCIEIDLSYLTLKVKKDKKAAHAFLEQVPHNLLVKYKNENALSVIIRRQLIHLHPSSWPELKILAQQLCLSEATIQRRLKNENTSYQQLKNDIRCDIAIDRLTHTQQSIQEISDALNFHEASAFHRAFKKWTGVSPGAYRQQTQPFI